MKSRSGMAAFAGVLVLFCGVVAWAWYVHVGSGRPVPQPVPQITAASPPLPAATAAATATQRPTPTPSATTSASPAPVVYVPQPAAQATQAPSPSASPVVKLTPYAASGSAPSSEEPMVAATLGPHAMTVSPVREAPNAPPRILAMSISTPVARGGEVVSGTVQTTSNVASVEARIAGYSSSMRKIGVGRFSLAYRVPYLPFFLHRTYTIEVIARNTRGDAVRTSLPITIR